MANMFLRTDVNKASKPTIKSDFYFSCNHQFLHLFLKKSTIKIYHDKEHPSKIKLPVLK